jgi:hypothetical protein
MPEDGDNVHFQIVVLIKSRPRKMSKKSVTDDVIIDNIIKND